MSICMYALVIICFCRQVPNNGFPLIPMACKELKLQWNGYKFKYLTCNQVKGNPCLWNESTGSNRCGPWQVWLVMDYFVETFW